MPTKTKFFTKLHSNPDVYLVPLPQKTDRVYVDVLIKEGFASESPRSSGTFHLLEHYIVGKHRDERGDFSEMHAEIDPETIKFWIVSDTKKAKRDIESFFRNLFAVKFDDAQVLEYEKQAVIHELKERSNSIEQKFASMIARDRFLGSCVHIRDLDRELKNTKKLTLTSLEHSYGKIKNGKSVIIAIGAYQPKKDLIDATTSTIRQYDFSNASATSFPSCKHSALKISNKKLQGVVGSYIFFSFPGFSLRNDPADLFTLSFILRILSGDSQYSAFKQLREEGIYNFEYSRKTFERIGAVALQTYTDPEKVTRAIQIISNTLRTAKRELIDPKLIREYITKGKRAHKEIWEKNADRYEWIIEELEDRRQPYLLADTLRDLQAMTPERIRDVARKIFRKGQLNLLIVGETKGIKMDDVKKLLVF